MYDLNTKRTLLRIFDYNISGKLFGVLSDWNAWLRDGLKEWHVKKTNSKPKKTTH